MVEPLFLPKSKYSAKGWIFDISLSQVGGERFEASEALFQPHLINKEGQGKEKNH